jgi:hypothetical protein
MEACQVSPQCAWTVNRTNNWERFFYVGRSSSATHPQEQKQGDDAWISISSRIDRISVFSRLALLAAVVDVTETPHQIQLILYRSISLTTLLEVSNKWTLAGAGDIVGLFTRESYMGSVYRPVLGNIDALVIKAGAYVSPPECTRYTHPMRNVKWCNGRVVIVDEVDVIGIKQTLELMFNYPGRLGEPGNDLCHVSRSKIALECSSYVLDLVTETVS